MNKYKLIITDNAKNDIKAIQKYIALDNILASKNFLLVLKKIFIHLANYPKMGKKQPNYVFDKNVYCHTMKWGYSILYSVENENIYILRILTGYQDILNNL